MKNVYLYIMFLLIGFSSLGQDLRNSNWLFGDEAWLKFSTNPNSVTSLSGSAMNVYEGSASVSDENGDLLFYTNGTSVFNKNHQPMLNGNNTLISTESNTQGVIIVPKPGNQNMYYVIYIDGNTGGKKGLRYSEVDMSVGIGQVVLSTRNTVLKDHNGININESYNNGSEKLTSTKHANGIDYWAVACIKGYVYSYLVSSTGISLANYTVSPLEIIATDNLNSSRGAGVVKISPDNQRIAIVYEEDVVDGENDGGILKGSFNNITGKITITSPVIRTYGLRPYGLEFSPNSANIYFSHTVLVTNLERKLYVMTTTNSYTSVATLQVQWSTVNPGILQLGIDNKIYIAHFEENKLAVINNPNNPINPNVQLNVIELVSQTNNRGGLPQLVHWQGTCPSDLILTSTIHDVLAPAQDNRQASNSITASNVVKNGAIGIYHAGEDVVLKPGFHSANGSKFRGYIEGCSGQFVGLKTSGEEESMRTASIEAEKELFTLYPNPASESVTIASDKVMQNVTVTSLDGFTLFQGDVKQNSFELNVSNYRKGIYIITVITEDGEMEMKKLMKE